ncbi:hypothetical protein GP5015_2171 [gamma proteobacterium HTCC5015]|nr:hypothetical protein GP5015_2171 [gamma proteobacterium HTCC5015]
MKKILLGSISLLFFASITNTWAASVIDERYYGNRIVVKMADGEKDSPQLLTPDKLQKIAPLHASKLSHLKRTLNGAECYF